MRQIWIVMAALLVFCSGVARGAEISRDAAERVRLLGEKAAKLSAGKTGEYAKNNLDAALASVTAAQGAIASGNEKVALQKADLAELQLTLAEAKAAEKELLEQVAVRRTELKKLEAQLERYRQGEEN